MKPINIGGHPAYQKLVLTQLRKYYPIMLQLLYPIPPGRYLRNSGLLICQYLISLKELALAGDGTPVYTSAQERKPHTCDCLEKGVISILDNIYFSRFIRPVNLGREAQDSESLFLSPLYKRIVIFAMFTFLLSIVSCTSL